MTVEQLSLILVDNSSTVLDAALTIVEVSSAELTVIDLPANTLGTLDVLSFITDEVVFAVASSGPLSISDVAPDPISSTRTGFCEPQVILGGKSDR